MKLTIKTIDGGGVDLDVAAELSVKNLKTLILEKMDIPVDKQRLICHGKVLNDDKSLKDYVQIPEDNALVLHLVHKAPHTSDIPSTDTATTDEPSETPEGENVTINQELVFLQSGPLGAQDSINEITQGLVDRVMSALNARGAHAEVTATASRVDSLGHTEHASASATSVASTEPTTSQPAPVSQPTPSQTAPISQPAPVSQPTTSQPTSTSQPTPPQPTPASQPTPSQPAPTSKPAPSQPAPASQQPKKRPPPPQFDEAEDERLERERREREHEYRQERNIRTHVKNAYKCLQFAEKVLNRFDKAEARLRAEQAAAASGSGEPMETSGARGGDPDDEVREKPFVDIEEMLKRNYGKTSTGVYASLASYQDRLTTRARPLIQRFLDSIRRDSLFDEDEAFIESQTAQTVRDFNYYMGHAAVSISRLHINMFAPPPRVLRITPPKKTEMRHIMSQMRSRPPPRPSGYIIDISRDGENGEEQTTRATVSTERPVSSGFFGGLSAFGGGLAGLLRGDPDDDNKEGKDEVASSSASGDLQSSGGDKKEKEKEVTKTPSMPSTSGEEKMDVDKKGSEKMDVDKKGSEASKKENKDDDDDDDSGGDDETPKYLARLMGELITGMVGRRGAEDAKDEKKDEGGAAASGQSGKQAEGGESGGGGTDNKPTDDKEGKKEEDEDESNELTFAQRYAGPEGSTVTIRQQPQAPYGIPGLPPVEGPSLTITNPGGGAEPELTVNFPMPPALQMLRNMLLRKVAEGDDSDSSDEGDKEGERGKPDGGVSGGEKAKPLKKGKKKSKRKPGEEPPKSELWKDEDGDVDSISDAGSIDSIPSDHEVPPLDNPLRSLAQTARAQLDEGQHESMLDTFTHLRQRYAGLPPDNLDDEDDPDIGMVEKLLQDISKELSVLEVMSVFNGTTSPLERLKPVLLEFIRERLLYGQQPTLVTQQEDRAVCNFLRGCIPSLATVEDQLPLRNPGINFPATVYNLFFTQCKTAYRDIVREYRPLPNLDVFAVILSNWAKMSGALFAQVVRHCIDGEQYFEDIIKMLVNTLFPPTTPPLILNMCNSTIYKQLKRVKEFPPRSPAALDKYLVWKEGYTPTPNKSYELTQFLADQPEFSSDMPTTFRHLVGLPVKDSVPGESSSQSKDVPPAGSVTQIDDPPPEGIPEAWVEYRDKDRSVLDETKAEQSFSDAYLSGMPAKKRKQLDMSEPQTVTADELIDDMITKSIMTTGVKAKGFKSNEEVAEYILSDEPGMSNSLRGDVQRGITRRLAEDPNFDKKKYPNTCKYFEIPDETSPEPGASGTG